MIYSVLLLITDPKPLLFLQVISRWKLLRSQFCLFSPKQLIKIKCLVLSFHDFPLDSLQLKLFCSFFWRSLREYFLGFIVFTSFTLTYTPQKESRNLHPLTSRTLQTPLNFLISKQRGPFIFWMSSWSLLYQHFLVPDWKTNFFFIAIQYIFDSQLVPAPASSSTLENLQEFSWFTHTYSQHSHKYPTFFPRSIEFILNSWLPLEIVKVPIPVPKFKTIFLWEYWNPFKVDRRWCWAIRQDRHYSIFFWTPPLSGEHFHLFCKIQ